MFTQLKKRIEKMEIGPNSLIEKGKSELRKRTREDCRLHSSKVPRVKKTLSAEARKDRHYRSGLKASQRHYTFSFGGEKVLVLERRMSMPAGVWGRTGRRERSRINRG